MFFSKPLTHRNAGVAVAVGAGSGSGTGVGVVEGLGLGEGVGVAVGVGVGVCWPDKLRDTCPVIPKESENKPITQHTNTVPIKLFRFFFITCLLSAGRRDCPYLSLLSIRYFGDTPK
jgi:hypothetical protein